MFAFVVYAGIIGYKGGIIISNYQVGGLYFHEFKTKQTTQLVDRWELPHPTGIALWDDRLLFVANGDNLITLFKLKDKARGVKAVKKGAITAPDFDGPRSPVVLGNNLFAVNSKIESLGFPRQGESDPEDFEVDFELIAILF